MLAALIITHPVTLTLACIGLSALAVAWRRPAHRTRALASVALVAAVAGLLTLLRLHGPLAGLAAAVAFAVTLFAYRREPLSRARRAALVVARLVTLALLLLFLARPAWERVIVTWDRPVLAVLLDHSASMGIADRPGVGGQAPTRAALVNAALTRAAADIQRLTDRYDVRLNAVGGGTNPLARWEIVPAAPVTALARALRDVRELRSARGHLPAAVLLVSDGAENAADAATVGEAAEELARQRTPLLAVGAGPEPGQATAVKIEPLAVPPRLGAHDLLRLTVGIHAQGCGGQTLTLDLLWDDELTASRALNVERREQYVEAAFELQPPAPGVHRLSARVTLPPALGGLEYIASAVVDVVADRVRVLYLERTPRAESAFIARAWRGDASLEVTRPVLLAPSPTGTAQMAELLTGYDVIVLGHVGPILPPDALHALVQAVTERGVGLLLAGGHELLTGANYVRSVLADVSPVQLVERTLEPPEAARFLPTAAGQTHPLLLGLAADACGSDMDEPTIWSRLPPLSGIVPAGPPKPAAAVLAADESGRPLLVAQEVGRGRCVVAAWESSWPWALASDEGHAVHTQLWRRMVLWLANRRPRAWVLTDRPQYALAGIAGGGQTIRIRAGVSGIDLALAGLTADTLQATLKLEPAGPSPQFPQPVTIPLERTTATWIARLPDAAGRLPDLSPGTYTVEFFARVLPSATDTQPSSARAPLELAARTQFSIVAQDVELQPPTADLGLLKAAAERTADCGGRYASLDELPALITDLAGTDRRLRIMSPVRYDIVDRDPWGLLVWLLLALGIEWTLRKRGGLA